jgi:hypothetical protein
MWPPRSPDLMPFDRLLQGYVKDQVHSQGVTVMNELKA